MRIQSTNLSFKRALSTEEKAQYQSCINSARKELGLKTTTAILFDYMVPSEKDKNIGIGTTFSENAQKFSKFLKEILGINALQINPQGVLKNKRFSPYSSGSTSIGEHIIDVFQLTTSTYQNILKPKDIEKYLLKENPDIVNLAEYEKITRQDYSKNVENYAISNLLKKAFSNFEKLDANSNMKKEYAEFEKDNKTWLDKESLFYALAEIHGSIQWKNWQNEHHKNLYLKNIPDSITQLHKELKPQIDFHKFVQFIAYKQLKIAKENFNKNGIKMYGDIPIGFSLSEQWGNREIFQNNYTYGFVSDEQYYDWKVPAPDLDKYTDPKYKNKIIDLFKNKFEHNLKKYNGIRVDAAWELVDPCIGKPEETRKIGLHIDTMNYDLLNLIEESAKKIQKDNYSPDNLVFEVLGGEEILNTKYYIQNRFPFTYITCDVANEMGTVQGYKNSGLEEDFLTVGIGTHDNDSLINLSNLLNGTSEQLDYMEKDIIELSANMNIPKEKLKFADFYRTIKFAELFTTKNQFFNTFDLLGLKNHINIGDVLLPDNWKNRIPINYEKIYFSNLQQNKGLNLPESLYYALKAKNINNKELENQLLNFAKILKENGPLTEAEANLMKK